MTRGGAGFSLLEVMIGSAILAVLGLASFDLLSMQRREVYGSERSLLLHARAMERLAEEESRLNVLRFSSPPGQTTTSLAALGVTETVSVERVTDCTGLWSLEVQEAYPDPATRISHVITVSRLVVDRDGLTRLAASVRSAP